jgi:thiamine pyrophosphokinase
MVLVGRPLGPSGTSVPVAIVLAGGDALRSPLVRPLPDADLVVAADSGLHHAQDLGLTVDLVVGDLDSVDPATLARAVDRGARVESHPVDKDATDLALAMDAASTATGRQGRILVVGGHGGRLDHLAANLALLASERYADVAVTALIGDALVTVVRGERRLGGRVDELVTLLTTHGPARGVTTSGLAFPLDRATLEPGSSLGVSNRFAVPNASVSVESGVLLAIQPNPHAEDPWP